MRTTMDAAGRLVVPKRLRDELGLRGGEELDLSVREGRLEIEPASVPMRLEQQADGGVAVTAERPMPVLTDEMVRDTLERVRR